MIANARIFTLTSASGVVVRLTNYGGIITSILAPDREGRKADIVLGHDNLDGYRVNRDYLGALVGRYANRIANARFTLDGQTFALAANEGPHCLHGGRLGFDQAVWEAAPFRQDGAEGVGLTHRSPDGDQGFPGTLTTRVTYTLTDRNELTVDCTAVTDRPTPVNLTQHTYWNLAGAGDVFGHRLQINGDAMTPVDAAGIPNGEIVPVAGGPFDFRAEVPLARAYDHNFVLRHDGRGLTTAARLTDPGSGRRLDVLTTEPGLQLYTGNTLDIPGRNGRRYGPHAGLCLETQHFPDSPNQPGFPSSILRPDSTWRSRTVFRVGVD